MFQMMGVFAVRALDDPGAAECGYCSAKAARKHCGRPFIDTKLAGRPGTHWLRLGAQVCTRSTKQFGVGTGTVQRLVAAAM
jgi:hypothetical protein